jgi:ATP phosphoribosyltransferase regulatory subunit
MKSKNLSKKILKTIKSRGFKHVELPSVMETNHILQRSGENFRKYLFSFNSSAGQEFSLNPDLSLSAILQYAKNNNTKREKVFYAGNAFRKSYSKKNTVINQIGIEIFSSKDENKDDKEIIDTSIKMLKASGFKRATINIGNFKLFELLIKKLPIVSRWQSRLIKFYWNEKYFLELLKRLESNLDIDPFVVSTDQKIYLKMKKEDPNKIIAGRSYKEILSRYENKLQNPRTSKTGRYSAKIIKEFLKIKTSLKDAPNKLNKFFKKHNLNIYVGKEFFPISNFNQKNLKFKFSSSNGRGKEVEYYDSFNFSIDIKFKNKTMSFITGGRYNEMAQKNLGFKKIPAVGAAINLGIYE